MTARTGQTRAAARALLLATLALALAACAQQRGPAMSFDPAPVEVGAPGAAPAGEPPLATAPAPEPPRRGPFAFLRRDRTAAPPPPDTPPDPAPPPEYLVGDVPPQPQAEYPQPSTRPRPFGFLFKRVPGEVEAATAAPAAPAGSETVAALALAEDPATAAPDTRRRGLFFGRNRDAAADTPPVTGPLPFGQVVTACGLGKRDMGVEVARSPGPGTYRLYDTNPASVAPRTQFITGFRDGCARRFTASLALFGTPAVHEATRYNPANQASYSQTDRVYEQVKRRVCGVRQGEFCPEDRIARMEREAAFVSVYRNFGDTGQWMEMFLHDRELAAHEVVTR